MAVAVQTLRVPNRWPAVVPVVALAVVFCTLGGTVLTHGAELGLAMEQGRQLATEAGAWLSTTAAQAFTMQCTHAVPR